MWLWKPHSGDQGTALVEMTLLAPLIAVLLLGIVDAERVLFGGTVTLSSSVTGGIFAEADCDTG